MNMRWLIIAGATAALGACATTDDPREGGFISGVQGLSSGAYERRVREREDNLAKLRAMQADLEQEGSALTAEKAKRQQILAQERSRLAELDADVGALQRKLAEMDRAGSAGDQRVQDLQGRVAGLKDRLARQTRAIDQLEGAGGGADALEGKGDSTDARRRQLEAQRAALQQEYEELLNLTLMLAE
jgi:chromosome segregation ATPase